MMGAMTSLAPPTNHTTYDLTASPETGQAVPVVMSWWSHPEPEHPQVRANADAMRGFVRHYRMHEHMRHYLQDQDGERTVLKLADDSAQILHHPLAREFGDFPVPHPFPGDIGNAVVPAGMGMCVVVAVPLPSQPSVRDLRRLPARDFGTARIDLRFDDAAHERYAEHPYDRIERMTWEETDPELGSALRFLYGLPPEGRPL
jgi:hypothetical protein